MQFTGYDRESWQNLVLSKVRKEKRKGIEKEKKQKKKIIKEIKKRSIYIIYFSFLEKNRSI